eukprot:1551392-Rhodomonas_salina.2
MVPSIADSGTFACVGAFQESFLSRCWHERRTLDLTSRCEPRVVDPVCYLVPAAITPTAHMPLAGPLVVQPLNLEGKDSLFPNHAQCCCSPPSGVDFHFETHLRHSAAVVLCLTPPNLT